MYVPMGAYDEIEESTDPYYAYQRGYEAGQAAAKIDIDDMDNELRELKRLNQDLRNTLAEASYSTRLESGW